MTEKPVKIGKHYPRKVHHQSSTQGKLCIIHFPKNVYDVIVRPLSDVSFIKIQESKHFRQLQNQPNVRLDEICYNIPNVYNLNTHGIHRWCYQNFTNIGKIRKRRQIESCEDEEPSTSKRSKRCTSTSRILLPSDVCLFCCKCVKKFKQQKEILMKCVTKQADDKIHEAATVRNDDAILTKIIEVDLVAREAWYHRSCYRKYTRILSSNPSSMNDHVNKNQIKAHDKAFAFICKYVEESVIGCSNVERISMLRERYLTYIQENSPEFYNPLYKTEKLKNKLAKHFGTRLQYWQPNFRSELVYSNEIPKGSAIEAGFVAAASEVRRLEEVGLIMHRLIKDYINSIGTLPWPPLTTFLLNEDSLKPPVVLQNFLALVIAGKLIEKANARVTRVAMSIAEDICYASDKGVVKFPKHLFLGMAVRHITGSAEIVTLLNRFGHCASYSMLLELETAMCVSTLTRDSVLPPTIRPGNEGVVHLCWDNFDMLEETPSGAGTTHTSHGIIMQELDSNSLPAMPQLQTIPRTKKTSFQYAPTHIEPCFVREKVEPNIISKITTADFADNVANSNQHNFMWLIARNIGRTSGQNVPSWSGWTSVTGEFQNENITNVDYMAPILEPITENSTVLKVLTISQQASKEVGQDYVLLTFDLAVAKKAYSLLWQKEQFNNVIVRLGAFHTIGAYLAAMGKRFAGSGFEDIIIESGICASGCIEKVMAGKHYNRAMRVHKLTLEALELMLLEVFQENQPANLLVDAKTAFSSVMFSPNHEQVSKLLGEQQFNDLYAKYTLFKEDVRQGKRGKTAQFWLDYIDKVWLLLRFQEATKKNDLQLHLACLEEMCPLFFSYDRQNYARYLSVYFIIMLNLKDSHPGAEELIKKKGFSVNRSTVPSSRNAVDITIEQTVNRHAKSHGGIVGFSRNYSAYHRWCVSRHFRTSYAEAALQMAGMVSEDECAHKDLRISQMKKSSSDVSKIIDAFENFMNPFRSEVEDDVLYCLSSGAPAPLDIENDLLTSNEKGEKAFKEFLGSRIVKKVEKFHDPIKRMKLKTFVCMGKTVKMTGVQKKVCSLRAERNVFGQLVVLSEQHNINIEETLSYPLGPVPWSLATADGFPVKTDKSKLLHHLEKLSPPTTAFDVNNAVSIVDGNAVLQSLVRLPDNICSLAKLLFDMLPKSPTVHFVTDSYHKDSIKMAERMRRGQAKKYLITGPMTKIPRDWKSFLSNSDNKTQIVKIILSQWKSDIFANQLLNRHLFVVCEDTCTVLSSDDGLTVTATLLEELHSSQEEADTKILLHCQYAVKTSEHPCVIVVRSPDTDVFLLLVRFVHTVNNLILFDTGTGNKRRLIDVNLVGNAIGVELSNALPAFHAFTGCDTTSAFVRRGKLTPLKILEKHKEYLDVFKSLGTSIEIDEDKYDALERFVCLMYGSALDKTLTINKLRYNIFKKKFTASVNCPLTNYNGSDLSLLPPCKSSLRQHIKRANYQTLVWNKALDAKPDIPGPSSHGWQLSENGLEFTWTEGDIMPNVLVDLLRDKNYDEDDDEEEEVDDDLNVIDNGQDVDLFFDEDDELEIERSEELD